MRMGVCTLNGRHIFRDAPHRPLPTYGDSKLPVNGAHFVPRCQHYNCRPHAHSEVFNLQILGTWAEGGSP